MVFLNFFFGDAPAVLYDIRELLNVVLFSEEIDREARISGIVLCFLLG